jgi:hypothetical protein
MKTVQISGTEHYAEDAPELLKRYESLSFADHHRSVIHLIPTTPGRVLDIGAGTRRYAAGFVALGHTVVAVEPTEELRCGAMTLHPSPKIEWINDSLPSRKKDCSDQGRRRRSPVKAHWPLLLDQLLDLARIAAVRSGTADWVG